MLNKERQQTDADFAPHLLGILREPPSPLPRLILKLLLLLITLTVVWAFWGQLDIVARAEGKLIPQTRLKVVQPLEGGRVSKILVREGQRVDAGEILILMDTNLSQADTRKLELQLGLNELHRRRVESELGEGAMKLLSGDDPVLFAQVQEQFLVNQTSLVGAKKEQQSALDQARNELAAAVQIKKKLEELLPIYRASEEAYASLEAAGNGAKMQLMEKRKERIEAEQDLRAQQHTIKALQEQIEQAEIRLMSIETSYRQQLIQERGEYDQRIAQLREDLDKQNYRNKLMELRAPENGIVQDLAVNTEGSVVPSGTVLLTVIPEDEPLRAEVFIENKDIGFVEAGQSTKVKLAAYSFQRYGMIEAQVEHISPDALQDQQRGGSQNSQHLGYKAILLLTQQELEHQGAQLPLRPGMQVSAEINIGSRSVVEYLLSPVKKTLSEAAHER